MNNAKKTRTLYLIRHGKPEYPTLLSGPGINNNTLQANSNIPDVPDRHHSYCIGQTDLPLSPLGKMQACLLHEVLNRTLSAIYCSPLSRAKETADRLADPYDPSTSGVPVIVVPDLIERSLGEWDGLSFEEIRRRWPTLYEARGTNPDLPIPGAESPQESGSRFQKAVRSILSNSTGDIAIVAHTDVISSFISNVITPFADRQNYRLPCGAYYQFSVDGQDNLFSGKHASVDSALHDTLSPEHIAKRAAIQLPHPPLTRELCIKLRQSLSLPETIIHHCDAVAKQALEFCSLLESHGYVFDKNLLCASAMLHDIARQHRDHASLGGKWLEELGYPQAAEIIRLHHRLNVSDRKTLNEEALVFLADKLIQGTEKVSLETRFADSRRKCTTPEAFAAHNCQYEQAVMIQEMIQALQ